MAWKMQHPSPECPRDCPGCEAKAEERKDIWDGFTERDLGRLADREADRMAGF